MEQLTIFDELFRYFKNESVDCCKHKIKVLSLFSGIGAFEKALDLLSEPYELAAGESRSVMNGKIQQKVFIYGRFQLAIKTI